jgi:hypothetical protein
MNPPETTLLSLSEADFDREFSPKAQPDGNSIWEHKNTLRYPADHVWSVVEVDDDLYVIPGYHVVNVIGYNVTTKSWPHENIEVRLDNPHDDHASNCKDGEEDCIIL